MKQNKTILKKCIQIHLFLILLCCCIGSQLTAQNWTIFPYGQQSWFEFENESIKATSKYYADSLNADSDSNRYYFHLKHLDNLLSSSPNSQVQFSCLDSLIGLNTWLEYFDYAAYNFVSIKEPLVEVQGVYSFKGNVVFDSNLQVGEGLFVTSDSYDGFDSVYIECESQNTVDVLGQMDEVKVFSLKAYANGDPIESEFDNYEYILSQNSGFVKFLPFIELLSSPKTTATLVGFKDDEDNLFGKAGWNMIDFFPYQPGDTIWSVYHEDDYGAFGEAITFSRYRTDVVNSVNMADLSYDYSRTQITEWYDMDIYDYVYDTISNSGTSDFSNNSLFNHIIYGRYVANQCGSTDFGQEGFGPSIINISLSNNDFSFEGEETSQTVVFSCYADLGMIITSSLEGNHCQGNLVDGERRSKWNTQLGKISSFSRSFEHPLEFDWRLIAYKKEDKAYNAYCVELDAVYDVDDPPVLLGNGNESGPGVVGDYFDPSMVPINLLNQPIEIICGVGLFEFSQTVVVETDACLIFDVVAEAYECDENKQFSVDLTFDFSGEVSGAFEVTGNGNNYGVYAYDELSEDGFITLGPFDGDGETEWEIVVNDLENPECQSIIQLGSVQCNCVLSNLFAEAQCASTENIVCDLEFDAINESSFFTVQINGNNVEEFAYEDIAENGFVSFVFPITAGETNWTISVFDNESPDCLTNFELEADCSNACQLNDLTAVGNCDDDTVVLDFDYVNTSNEFFDVHVIVSGVEEFVDYYAFADLPITIQVPEGSESLSVSENDNAGCNGNITIEYPTEEYCQSIACAINNLTAVGNCDDDTVVLDFDYVNTSNEFFDVHVIVSGVEEFVDYYAFADLPITIQVPEGSEALSVSENDNAGCSGNITIEYPTEEYCQELACAISNLTAVGMCMDDMLQVEVNFEDSNTENEFFEVWVDDVFLAVYGFDELPITLILPDGSSELKVRQNENCFAETSIIAPICSGLNDLSNLDIRISQSNNQINIVHPGIINVTDLYSINGKQMYSNQQSTLSNGVVNVPLVGLPSGLYILRFQMEQGQILSHKIVVP